MGNSQFERTPLCFFRHRPLKSGTYHSLNQILSHCNDHFQVSNCQEPRLESCERGELVGTNCLVFEKDRVDDEAIGFNTMEIDEDENDSLLQLKDQDLGLNQLLNELEHIVKGNGKLINDQEEHVDIEQMVNEESEEAQQQVDKGHHTVKISEQFDSSVDQSMLNCQISQPSGDCEDGSSLSRTDPLELEHEMQQKVMALEKLAHTDCTMGSHNYMAEDVEVEEGEISGGFGVCDALVDNLFDNDAISEEKKDDDKQVSKDIIDKLELICNDQIRANEAFSECSSLVGNAVDCTSSGTAVELKEIVDNEKQFELKNVVLGTSMVATDAVRSNSVPAAGRNKRKASRYEGDVGYQAEQLNSPTTEINQSPNGKQGIISELKLDSSVCSKKKRSTCSKERKAKKKQKERKKRAEKNRQLGVKRLKLKPVLKPKTVTYCRHYLMGRCQEGETCKFSHDTIPLTKSKPCCHFARNSCMKGDDCPFDHQLSKYPCNNFSTRGFCNRGDDCMFSHKRPSKEDTPSSLSTSKTELKPPSLLNISNPQKLANTDQISCQNVDGLFGVGKVSSLKNAEQNVAETPLRSPALTPKGINCLFLGKSSVVESSKPKQGSSSPKRNEGSQVGNQSEQSVFVSVQKMNGTPNRALPAIAPRGVNFLSFGKAPLEDSSEKLASGFWNSENGVKPLLLNNFNLHKQGSSPCDGEKSIMCGNQTTQSVSSAVEKSNELLKRTHPSLTPRGSNFLSVEKDFKNISFIDKIASFSSSSNNGINRSFQESHNTPDKHGIIPWTPPASLLGTGYSSDRLAKVQYKSTPCSSQQAVMSTLAFASKIETEKKIKASAVSTTTANCQTRNNRIDGAGSSGGPLNDLGKASKILKFL